MKQDKLFLKLKEAIKERDNEYVHSVYDQLIKLRLRQHEPSFVRRLDKLVKGIAFWFA